jgi:hypothetical protein
MLSTLSHLETNPEKYPTDLSSGMYCQKTNLNFILAAVRT